MRAWTTNLTRSVRTVKQREAVAKYSARFPDDPLMRSLGNWAAFEPDNPDTFAGMYKFWARKPAWAGARVALAGAPR
jgi:hypothetical protein